MKRQRVECCNEETINYSSYISTIRKISDNIIEAEVPWESLGLKIPSYFSINLTIPIEDYLYRTIYFIISGAFRNIFINIEKPGQNIEERSIVKFHQSYIKIVFTKERNTNAIENDCHDFYCFLEAWISHIQLDQRTFESHLKSFEDQLTLREFLKTSQGICFIANGSLLAKNLTSSENSLDPPLCDGSIPFTSPKSLEVEVTLPHNGIIKGMLLSQGVSVITGGGYHGKSTILKAIASGIYNKVPGDGREYVVSIISTVAIRAEDGRYAYGVDISPFISDLPSAANINPINFISEYCSGSTSQATNIMEALEVGATVFLLDEDSCAANFMTRDSRMRSMIAHETITPFIYRVNSLFRQFQISSVIVVGGCGDWFDVQDTTLLIDNYQCQDATSRAKSISKTFCHGRVQYNGRGLVHQLIWPWHFLCNPRYLDITNINSINFFPKSKDILVAKDGLVLQYGNSSLDLSRGIISDPSRLSGGGGGGGSLALGIGFAIRWILNYNHSYHQRILPRNNNNNNNNSNNSNDKSSISSNNSSEDLLINSHISIENNLDQTYMTDKQQLLQPAVVMVEMEDNVPTISTLLDLLETEIDSKGIQILYFDDDDIRPILRPHRFEISATLFRFRELRFRQSIPHNNNNNNNNNDQNEII